MEDKSMTGFETYLKQVGAVHEWAGNLKITAVASTMDRPITVLHEAGQVYQFNASGANREIFLFYANQHYELLEVTWDAKVALHTKAMPGKTQGGREAKRGGGKRTESAPSLGGHTVASKAASSLGSHTRGSGQNPKAESLGGKTAGTVRPEAPKSASLGGKTKAATHKPVSVSSGSVKRTISKEVVKPLVTSRRSKAASSSDVKQLSKVDLRECKKAGVDENQILVGKRKPKDTWTCKLCLMQFHAGHGKLTLAQKRSNHIANRHPNEREKCGTIREYMEPVAASNQIPLPQRDWLCPFCDMALPSLSKTVKEASVKLHYSTHHPRRKIVAGKLTSLRWKLAKKDPDKVINYREGMIRQGEAKQRYTAERIIPKAKGHHVVPVKVNWETWPRLDTEEKIKYGTMVTCKICRRVVRGSGARLRKTNVQALENVH